MNRTREVAVTYGRLWYVHAVRPFSWASCVGLWANVDNTRGHYEITTSDTNSPTRGQCEKGLALKT